MKFLYLSLFLLITINGCALTAHNISMLDLPQSNQKYVIDQTKPDDYPSFMAGEGNDFSCRYGIHYESSDEFSPTKVKLFSELLAKEFPPIITHKVTLQRFDVYYNHRLKGLRMLSSVASTYGMQAVARMDSDAAHQNMGVYTEYKLLVDTQPETDRHPKQNQVGCSNEHEGEYYPSEISGGHSVVVTWLKFAVDDHPYYIRTFYQVQPENREEISNGIKEAIVESIQAVTNIVKKDFQSTGITLNTH